MTVETSEQLSGTGSVHRRDGAFLGRAGYELQVLQELTEVTTKDGAETISTRKWVEGQVTDLDNPALIGAPESLTLTLRDGRQLDFRIVNLTGRIAAINGLYDPL